MKQSNDKPIDVIGLGTILVDHQVVLSKFPDADTKNPITNDRYQVGGPVPTALAMLRRLGMQCDFIGKWSHDAFGQMIMDDLKLLDINCDESIRAKKGRTGFAHVWIDASSGSRTVAYSRGDLGEITLGEIASCKFSACRVLHLDGWSGDAAKIAAQQAKAAGATIVLDAGSPKSGTADLLPYVDVINCPTRFAREFFGIDDEAEAAQQLIATGINRAIFTNGDAGATCYSADETFHVPAFSVEAVDTTGAGDVFCGGLIYGILEQFEWRMTVLFASACAAMKCRSLGNRDALPALDAILDFMHNA